MKGAISARRPVDPVGREICRGSPGGRCETSGRLREERDLGGFMANTFHVSVYVRSIPEAVAQYRKVLGIEPAKVRADYAKFELSDPPVVFSLNVGGEPGRLSHLGIRYPTREASPRSSS